MKIDRANKNRRSKNRNKTIEQANIEQSRSGHQEILYCPAHKRIMYCSVHEGTAILLTKHSDRQASLLPSPSPRPRREALLCCSDSFREQNNTRKETYRIWPPRASSIPGPSPSQAQAQPRPSPGPSPGLNPGPSLASALNLGCASLCKINSS